MVRLALALLTLAALCGPQLGCGHAHQRRPEDMVVRAARARLGAALDEERFLGGVLGAAGRRPREAVTLPQHLHALAAASGRLDGAARPGAIVFFAETERPFHAGVVEKVDGARVTFLHVARGQVRRGVCDEDHPAARRDGRGRLANTYLVPRRKDDLPGTRYLCGQLLAGYARF